jgi:hypothetical protein
MKSLRRSYSILEYMLFTMILIAALVGMSMYMVSSLGGKWRGVGDTFGHGRQYEPGKTTITGG